VRVGIRSARGRDAMKSYRGRLIHWVGALLSLATAATMGYRGVMLPHEPFLGMSERGVMVALVIPGGPADRVGLVTGDRVLSINGAAVESLINPSAVLRHGRPGQPIRLQVEREGTPFEVQLVPERLSTPEILWKLAHAGVALAMLLVGTLVFLRKAGRLTVVFFGICLCLSSLMFRPYVLPGSWGLHIDALGAQLVSAFLPGLLLHFFLLFPYERAALKRYPSLHVLVYSPGLLLLALDLLSASRVLPLGSSPERLGSNIDMAGGFCALASLVGSVVLFAQAYRGSPLPTIRRKLKVTLFGTLLGLVPLLLVLALHTARPDLRIPGDRVATLMVFFLPASFGYAILRHGIFEIEFIVKRSLVYSGLTASIVLAYFLVYFILHTLLHNVTGVSSRLGSILAVAFVLLLMSPLRGRIQEKLDHWVYPDRYDIRFALREAGSLLRQAIGIDGVERALLQSVRSLLGVQQAGLFRRANGDETYALSTSLEIDRLGARVDLPRPTTDPSDRPPPPSISLGRALADPLFRAGSPALREDLEAELPYGFLPRTDLDALQEIDARILIPLASGARRLGILVLGPRRFGEAYSSPDLELLDGLQAQAVLAMENATFKEESEVRAGFQREMEVARALQQQLLPRRLPRLPAFEIAADNVPCHEIGGDYYDVLQISPADLTVAIGDVSGKGVPAALLMANVQATFRAESASGNLPADVLDRMNRRLCGIEHPERFVSFFCGRLDLASRRFSYANAGHLHPMLIRVDGRVDRLDRGGLLLGILEGASYEGGEVTLHPGDVLVMYTDGVVERGGAQEIFGESDLLSLATDHRHLSAPDLLGRTLEELGRLTGSTADDDTTLMILKAL
jgi:phosphoserine phosphatase RsbU/P